MSLLQVDHNPSARQLAVFGLLWVIAFATLGRLVLRWTGAPWAAGACWALAGILPAAGALRPGALRFAYVALALATAPIGLAVSFVVLAAVYYLAVAPIGLLLRALGHDPMARCFDPRAASYWTEREPEPGPERHFRQF